MPLGKPSKTRFAMLPIVAVLGVASAVTGGSALAASATATPPANHTFAGYLEQNKASYHDIRASFVVPTVTCSGDEDVSFWVGLDDNKTVAQTGIDVPCTDGQPWYYAWYAFYPHPKQAHIVNHDVKPGDHMTTRVHNYGRGNFTTTISDSTEGWSVSRAGHTGGTGATAELLLEKEKGPLANFGTTKFTNVLVDGRAMGKSPAKRYTLVNANGETQAKVGAWGGSNRSNVAFNFELR